MNASRLIALYDRAADAPDAISLLRRLVLDLAIRGKLVQQDPSDVSPADCLSRVREELQTLAESAARMRWKHTDPVAADEVENEVPPGWVAARVNDTGLYINGLAFKPGDWKQSGVPIIRIGNLTDPEKEFNYAVGTFPDEVMVRDGDLLVSWSATLEAFRWDRGEGVLNQHIFRVIPHAGLTDRSFLLLLLRHAIREMADSEHAHGLVMAHINRGPFLNHIVLIPPLAEQRRIVAKVEELMALLDRLEAARTAREAARDRLGTASQALLNTPDPETSQEAVRLVLNELPVLTSRPDQITALRRTILSLAVRGKLVSQASEDEPAPVGDLEARQHDGRLDVEIPTGWRWVRVESVANARLGKMLDKAKNRGQFYPYLRNTNVHWFDIRLGDLKSIRLTDDELEEYRLKAGDVLICEGGHGIGRTAVWRGAVDDLVFQKALHRVRPGEHLHPEFFAQCCFVYFDEGIMQTYFTGVGIPHFTGRALAKLVFPLPPLAEQRRIVEKVDQLMGLCDQLEAALAEAETTRARLLEALLREALAPLPIAQAA